MNKTKVIFILVLAGTAFVFFTLGGGEILSLDYVRSQLSVFTQKVQNQPILTGLVFVLIYVLVTTLSIPGALVLTLLGGSLFGLVWGSILVSIGSTIGATLAFLGSRYLFQTWIEQKFKTQLLGINKGLEKEGLLYILTLRLIPVFPFFIVNLVLGLTRLPLRYYVLLSWLGMLPATVVYVNAGEKLAQLDSLKGLVSFEILLAFSLLGLLPLILGFLINLYKSRKLYSQFSKPKVFDYNMIVIGGGSAGLVSAYIASAVKAKVALIERHKMGGDCLNTGCVPSKALIRSARAVREMKCASKYGLIDHDPQFSFAEVMERVQKIIQKIEPHDSVERYTGLGVECLSGEARVLSPYQVELGGKILTAQNIVIATGARPRIPQIEGLEEVPHYTSDTIWSLREKPKSMLVLGGGPIGCELAQAFATLGISVTIVDSAERILTKEDVEVSHLLSHSLEADGVKILTGSRPQRFVQMGNERHLEYLNSQGETQKLSFEVVLLAVGRVANVTGFGLEELGIEMTPQGTIAVDECLRTKYKNIFACGDVAGPFQFTHAASHQAWFCAVNALFAPFVKFKVDYHFLPWSTFTAPEVARIGLSETEAQSRAVEFEVTRYGIDDLDRAIADSCDEGFVKVITAKGSDKILGVTIVADHASDLLPEFVLAMKHGLGLGKILGTIHAYPTMSEANKYAAGVWRRSHAPERALAWLARFHRFRRG